MAGTVDYAGIRDQVHGAKDLVKLLKDHGVEDPQAFLVSAVYSKAKDAVYRAGRNKGLKELRDEVNRLQAQLKS